MDKHCNIVHKDGVFYIETPDGNIIPRVKSINIDQDFEDCKICVVTMTLYAKVKEPEGN